MKSRNTKTAYEKLSVEEMDTIRGLVHDQFRRFAKKSRGKKQNFDDQDATVSQEEPAIYPTIELIHNKIVAHPDLPSWSKSTTSIVLKEMGFRYFFKTFFFRKSMA